MKTIDYQHKTPNSFESKIIQSVLGILKIKMRVEEKIETNCFAKDPAKPSEMIAKKFSIAETTQNKRSVWTISPKTDKTEVVALFLHGGAYMANISKPHWDFAAQIVEKANLTMVIPDYPLAPKYTCNETYTFINDLYKKMITDYPTKQIVFIGDSAGGGLALGFVQYLRDKNKKQPNQIILFSPWLDISMSNPRIATLEQDDKLLTAKGLRIAGQKFAGSLDVKDYRVSPIYGDLSGLCTISVFTGTKEILHADALELKQILHKQQICFNYFEYPGMFHDWVIVTSLKESKDAIDKTIKLINNNESEE